MANLTPSEEEHLYQVMPQHSGKYEAIQQPAAPKPAPVAPVNSASQAPNPQPQTQQSPPPADQSPLKSKAAYIIVGLIVLVVLGALVYFMIGGKKQEEAPAQQLPKAWLLKYFNMEVCDDVARCGDEADPDNDGLTNYEEFKKSGTSLTNADSDGDGLADGDEVNVYNTESMDKYTDKRPFVIENNLTDGHQVKNGYDPLTPGLKFTETRLSKIEEAIDQYGLHEPTITTIKPNPPAQPAPTTQTETETESNLQGN